MSSDANTMQFRVPAWKALLRRALQRRRMTLQTEHAECGLACLSMIADHYGYEIDLVSLRQRHPVSSRGTDLRDLADAAGDLHFASRALKAEIEELGAVRLPCILHWGTNHFVVLTAINAGNYIVLDPARGERRIAESEFAQQFTGVLLELWPTDSFRRAQLRRQLKLTDLWTSIRGLGPSMAQIVLLSLLLQALGIGAPLYTQFVIDAVVAKNQWALLLPIALGFGLVMLTQAAISLLRSYAILHLSNRLSVQMAANLFYHLVRLPLSYFMKRHLGDVLSRFQSLQQVRQMMTTGIVSAWLDGFMVIATLAVMFYYSTLLSLVIIALVAVYVALRVLAFRKVKLLKQEQLIAGANESSHFMETMRAIQTLKIFQKENDRQGQWLNRLATLINKDTQIAKWEANFGAAQAALFGAEHVLVIYLCVRLIEQQQFSVGMLFAFLSFKINFTRAVGMLISQGMDFLMLDIHFERISDIVFTGKERGPTASERCNEHVASARTLSGRIEVSNLGFRFEGNKQFAFRNISFCVEPGESLAITGPSGCGKTTLMKCLMGLLEPTEGTIRIDGYPLSSIANYRSQIAGVMQDDQLISGSIKDNIAFSARNISMERVQECARAACVHEEIVSMPMQYETLVGDLGNSLSGGQKQRVILARALYRAPRILFMDEATSHLDVECEQSVSRQIGELSITRVLIAHRPETVRAAGRSISIAFSHEPQLESVSSKESCNA